MERVVSRPNMLAAYRRVLQNKGSPGVDGLTVGELAAWLQPNWERVREELLAGSYQPAAIRRQAIPKPGGGERELGIPTVPNAYPASASASPAADLRSDLQRAQPRLPAGPQGA
jgi:hypothetical protein